MNTYKESQERVICILAGGKGKRIGKDKALIKLCNKRLIDIAVENAKLFSKNIVISCGKRRLNLCVEIEDMIGEGPMAGIYSVLRNYKRVLFFPVDMPFIEPHLFEVLWERSKNYHITIVKFKKRLIPTLGVYTNECVFLLERKIKKKDLSLKLFVKEASDKLKVNILSHEDLKVKKEEIIFLNINTEEDLKIAEKYKDDRCI